MLKRGKVAVVGDKDSVLAFKAIGAEIFNETEPEKITRLLRQLIKDEYTLILITEKEAESAVELIKQQKTSAYPIIIPIPSSQGSTGLGIRGLKQNIEKAIGTDIIFNREGKK